MFTVDDFNSLTDNYKNKKYTEEEYVASVEDATAALVDFIKKMTICSYASMTFNDAQHAEFDLKYPQKVNELFRLMDITRDGINAIIPTAAPATVQDYIRELLSTKH